jgi:hypothetical protein
MNYTTKINFGEWEDGDVICFPYNNDGGKDKPSYDLICEIKNGRTIEIPENEEITPNENWSCFRIDYKFISDGTWYIEGTEAYPTNDVDSENNGWGSGFKGWTNETFNDYDGELPRWDGEICSLDEFKIVKRK